MPETERFPAREAEPALAREGFDPELARRGAESLSLLLWLARLERLELPAGGDPTGTLTGLPRDFGRFRLLQLLGRGAYGAVFAALDTRIEKRVALKIAWPGVLVDAEMSRRFTQEPRTLAALRHRGIVEVYEADEADMLSYISMELIEGPTLADWRRDQQQVTESTAVRIVLAIAEAVHAAHAAGVVHRDLKPMNVLLRPIVGDDYLSFEPVVTDFGLARRLDVLAGSQRTATCAVLGTKRYMSPEQAAGRNDLVGPTSDVYSLGVILFELLTGVSPGDGIASHLTGDGLPDVGPAPSRQRRRDVSRKLVAIADKCLEKLPANRYATALDLADDLQRFLDNRPIRATAMSRRQRVQKVLRRRPLRWAFAAGIAAAVLVGGLFSGEQEQPLSLPRLESPTAEATGLPSATARTAYDRAIQLAAESLRLGKRQEVLQLLRQAREAVGGAACGLEWRLLARLVHEYERSEIAHAAGVCRLQFSPDGRRLYSAGKDGRVLCWNARTWVVEQTLDVGHGEVHFAEPSNDGALLAVACELGRLVIYRTDDWTKVYDADVIEQGRIFAATWLGGGTRLAIGGKGSVVHIIDATTGEHRTSEPLGVPAEVAGGGVDYAKEVDSLAFDPDHSRLFASGYQNMQFCIDAHSLKVLESRRTKGISMGAICYIPYESGYVAESSLDAIGIWDPQQGRFAGQIPALTRVRSLVCTADGQELIVGYDHGAIECWSVPRILADNAGSPRRLLGSNAATLSLALSPDESQLVSGADDGGICWWPSPTYRAPVDEAFTGVIEAVRYSDCGKWLAVVERQPDGLLQLAMYDAGTREERWRESLGHLSGKETSGAPFFVGWPIAFCPQSREIAVADGDLRVRTRLVATGQTTVEGKLAMGQLGVRLQFSTDGEYLIHRQYHRNGLLRSWWTNRATGVDVAAMSGESHAGWLGSFRTEAGDLWLDQQPSREILVHGADAAREQPAVLRGATDVVFAATCSQDGSLIAAGGIEGVVYCWDLKQNARLIEFIGHHAPILDVRIAPDKRTLVSLGNNGVLRLWDIETGAALLTLGGDAERIVSAALHPLGDCLVLAVERDDQFGLRTLRLHTNETALSPVSSLPRTPAQARRDVRKFIANAPAAVWRSHPRPTHRRLRFSSSPAAANAASAKLAGSGTGLL